MTRQSVFLQGSRLDGQIRDPMVRCHLSPQGVRVPRQREKHKQRYTRAESEQEKRKTVSRNPKAAVGGKSLHLLGSSGTHPAQSGMLLAVSPVDFPRPRIYFCAMMHVISGPITISHFFCLVTQIIHKSKTMVIFGFFFFCIL